MLITSPARRLACLLTCRIANSPPLIPTPRPPSCRRTATHTEQHLNNKQLEQGRQPAAEASPSTSSAQLRPESPSPGTIRRSWSSHPCPSTKRKDGRKHD